ncbi:D-amino acid dehydrogenase [Haematospirillum jordaniae]|uniref:D-amino acid dehydrogenase n=1 Tax=Haematospirillum jordaniae TaxID=1549855 RepID=UPI001ADE4C12|nr:D-amino acid dehydrogenase [Haematospirillum jordaniae]
MAGRSGKRCHRALLCFRHIRSPLFFCPLPFYKAGRRITATGEFPVKVLVLGAGVVGTCTAWWLSQDGHEVHVLDRQPAVARETSFANGGQVSVSHATPWASFHTLRKAVGWLGDKDAPLVMPLLRYDPALWRWILRFLVNCPRQAVEKNTLRTVHLALYSRETLKQMRKSLSLEYSCLSKGILHVFRNQHEYDFQCRSAEIMISAGLPQRILNRNELTDIEPALTTKAHELVGGIYSPDDESGDARAFTEALAAKAQQNGVTFHTGIQINHLLYDGTAIGGVSTNMGIYKADAFVIALGSYSPKLLAPLGLHLPVYPAKGYSITIPLADHAPGAPVVSVTDDENKMVFSRLGNRLRAAGTAQMTGWNTTLDQKRADVIRKHATSLFPDAGNYAASEIWCGLRPKTPDSVPYICKTPYRGLFLNTGHGTLGWTMSAGSGRLMADLVSGRTPDIDPTGYGLEKRVY